MAKPAPFPHHYTGSRRTRVTTSSRSRIGAAELTVPTADLERARRILDTAEKHCIISNALRVAVTLQADIRSAASSAA